MLHYLLSLKCLASRENPLHNIFFRWIENIGASMIQEIEITSGSTTIQKYTGEYLSMMVDRDFNSEKKELFNNSRALYCQILEDAKTSAPPPHFSLLLAS